MRRVIYGKNGTGSRLQIDGLELAGKSGTAQVPNRPNDDAWFVAFAPYEQPEIAIVVVVEGGGGGGGSYHGSDGDGGGGDGGSGIVIIRYKKEQHNKLSLYRGLSNNISTNNFTDLDARNPEKTTASNLLADDATTKGLFSTVTDFDLKFKSLKAGPNVSFSSDANQITLTSSGIVSIQVVTDSGSLNPIGSTGLARFLGTGSTQTSGVGTDVTINSQLIREIAPSLGGNLDAAGNNITNLGTLTVQNVDGLVKGIDVGNIDSVVGFDLGGILPTAVSNLMQWFESLKPLDMGSTATPHATNVDLGSIA